MGRLTHGVLIADDNDTVRMAIRSFLEINLQMYVCGEASNGLEAVELAKRLSPDLILMDLSMPSMNGVEAAFTIRQRMPDARIIAFTLYSDSVGRAMARAVGVDVVVSKSEGSAGLMAALLPLLQSDSTFCA
jgi:DNA-binding NarL/FixJ family response regulator